MQTRNRWTANEIDLAALIYASVMFNDGRRKEVFAAIMQATGRTQGVVSTRFYRCGPTFDDGEREVEKVRVSLSAMPGREVSSAGGLRLSDQQIAERDARKAAADQRTYSQEFFNEPPPGFSALEEYRRRQAAQVEDRRPVISIAASIGQMRSDYR
jgi:hypothetical protein